MARGFVPHDEVDVAHRRYRRERGRWGPSPPTANDAATVASDFAAMQTAEQLAVEFVAAAHPLGVVAAQRFWWTTDWPRSRPTGTGLHVSTVLLCEDLAALVGDAAMERAGKRVWPVMRASGFAYEFEDRERLPRGASEEWFAAGATDAAGYELVWDEAAREGMRLPRRAKAIPKGVRGAPMNELRNPFTPLVALWATGYGIDSANESGLYLVCPRVLVKTQAESR